VTSGLPRSSAGRRRRSPGAIAGILFAVLFGVSVTMIDNTMADLSKDTGA